MINDKIPALMDEVANKHNDMSGTVIAKYIDDFTGETRIDVRGVNNRVYYNSPIVNWSVVKECDE